MMKKKKLIVVCSMIICLYLITMCMPLLYIFLDSTGVIDNIIYGKYVPTKEEIFQLLKDEQDEFELLVGDTRDMLINSGESLLYLDGKKEYTKSGLKNELLKKYPIKVITAHNSDGILEVRFRFEMESDSETGIYYTSNGEPSDWGWGKESEENNGVYTKKGPYYIYEAEKITENWYYFHVILW